MSKNLLDVHLIEFQKLRDEEIERIKYRDNLYYLTILVSGGVLSAGFTLDDAEFVLLALPVLLLALTVTYVNNDEKISSMGRYVSEVLALKIAKEFSENPENIFEWEGFHKKQPKRRSSKIVQTLTKILIYPVSAVAAIVLYVNQVGLPGLNHLVCFWITFDFILIGLMVFQVFGSSDIPKRVV